MNWTDLPPQLRDLALLGDDIKGQLERRWLGLPKRASLPFYGTHSPGRLKFAIRIRTRRPRVEDPADGVHYPELETDVRVVRDHPRWFAWCLFVADLAIHCGRVEDAPALTAFHVNRPVGERYRHIADAKFSGPAAAIHAAKFIEGPHSVFAQLFDETRLRVPLAWSLRKARKSLSPAIKV